MSDRTGYSPLQIGLHWLIAFAIFAAYFTSEDMGKALRTRLETGASGTEGNTLHVWLGGAVLVLVLVRIVVRLLRGAPGMSPETPPLLATVGKWGHKLLYVLMVIVPLGGAVTWYGGVRDAGDVHGILGTLLMLVVAGHVVAAVVHEALVRDGTMQRMIRPGD